MVECASIEEAREIPGVIHIEASNPPRAYVVGDKLPSHLIADPSPQEANAQKDSV